MIYTEEGRDRLDDPLATNFKCVFDVLENRCQFLIPLNGEWKNINLIGMKNVQQFFVVQLGHPSLSQQRKSIILFFEMNRACRMA